MRLLGLSHLIVAPIVEIYHDMKAGLLRRPKWFAILDSAEAVSCGEGDLPQAPIGTCGTWHRGETSTHWSLFEEPQQRHEASSQPYIRVLHSNNAMDIHGGLVGWHPAFATSLIDELRPPTDQILRCKREGGVSKMCPIEAFLDDPPKPQGRRRRNV